MKAAVHQEYAVRRDGFHPSEPLSGSRFSGRTHQAMKVGQIRADSAERLLVRTLVASHHADQTVFRVGARSAGEAFVLPVVESRIES